MKATMTKSIGMKNFRGVKCTNRYDPTCDLPPFLNAVVACLSMSVNLIVRSEGESLVAFSSATRNLSISDWVYCVSSMSLLAVSPTVMTPTCVLATEMVKALIIVTTKFFCWLWSDNDNTDEESKAKTTSMGNGHAEIGRQQICFRFV